MDHFFLGKVFQEHHGYPQGGDDVSEYSSEIENIYFKGYTDCKCVEIIREHQSAFLRASYYVGVDWISKNKPIYIEPKHIDSDQKTDCIKMLLIALKHPDVPIDHLFEIKFDAPYIEIDQAKDLLSPLLIAHFLRLVRDIVRKGLKKSYYTVERNLNAKVKGKVMVGKTIKKNVLRGDPLHTYCRFGEFGINTLENRLIKKTLVFIQRYLSEFKLSEAEVYTNDLSCFILPAFTNVSEEINVNDIKHYKPNNFYKEYTEAIRLAKLILKRFGYSINTVQKSHKILTPPFWIDMSKLFELYVLGLLKDSFGDEVSYHDSTYGNEIDFLLKKQGFKMVIDAKYKPIYHKGRNHWDIRQVSGYARLEKVYKILEKPQSEMIDCLIIYPLMKGGKETLSEEVLGTKEPEKDYVGIYKLGISLPYIKTINL